jgi:protein tyrosine/serine phosphatase
MNSAQWNGTLISELSYQVPLENGRLYAGAALVEEDYPILKTIWRIKVIVNLREKEEERMITPPPSWYERGDFRVIRFPIKDQRVPDSIEKTHELILTIQASLGAENVYIHCLAGQGRTGTIVACYLIFQEKLSALDAIQKVRVLFPRSIHTERQEGFVQEYEQFLKKVL